MKLKTLNDRAFTLVEVMVVISIVIVVTTTIWLAVGPAVKSKGVETRIRSDLRQIVTAINIYRADNDDRLPTGMHALPPTVPRKFPNWPQYSEYNGGNYSDGAYYYTMPYIAQVFDQKYAKFKWDQAKDPIVMATFYLRKTGAKYKVWEELVDGNGKWRERDEYLCLNASVDGSVRWGESWQQFMEEFADKSYLLFRK